MERKPWPGILTLLLIPELGQSKHIIKILISFLSRYLALYIDLHAGTVQAGGQAGWVVLNALTHTQKKLQTCVGSYSRFEFKYVA